MNDHFRLGPWIRRFLLEHLVGERNLAHNTQTSYRDTLLLFLPFVAKKLSKPIDQLAIEHISADLVRQFLLYLEDQRLCSISTRNQRLAAIHAMARFIGERSPEHIAWLSEIRSIPFKKTSRPSMVYLDKHEMDALLDAPNPNSLRGLRDRALLLFLYNSGARASEAAQLSVADLDIGNPPSVRLRGKGGKLRRCPLWPQTANKLTPLVVFQPSSATPHTVRNPRPCQTICTNCQSKVACLVYQANQSTHHSPHHRGTSVALRCRHQYDPCLAGTCFSRYHPYLCRGRS